MKKLLAVAVLFTAFSFTSLDANAKRLPDPTQTDCVALPIAVHDAWTSQGFTHRFASGKADEAYDDCISI